jgi:golgin subfamily B member 1
MLDRDRTFQLVRFFQQQAPGEAVVDAAPARSGFRDGAVVLSAARLVFLGVEAGGGVSQEQWPLGDLLEVRSDEQFGQHRLVLALRSGTSATLELDAADALRLLDAWRRTGTTGRAPAAVAAPAAPATPAAVAPPADEAQQHQLLIRQSPLAVDSYHALWRIYMGARQPDKAWCVCRALAYLKQAEPREAVFFEKRRVLGDSLPRQPLTDELWVRCIFHPDEEPAISRVFRALCQTVALLKAQPHKQLGLKRKNRTDPHASPLNFCKVFNSVSQAPDVPQPELYFQPEQPFGLALASCEEKGVLIPSFVVGSELLAGRSDEELAFAIANMLAFLRPEHYLRVAVPTVAELQAVFLAALRLVAPQAPVVGDQAVIGQYVDAIRRSGGPAVLAQLALAVQHFVHTRSTGDIGRWARAVDLTAHRVGFILCNDLEAAARMVSTEPVQPGGPSAKDKIVQLVSYSVSEEYFAVRAHLGIHIR